MNSSEKAFYKLKACENKTVTYKPKWFYFNIAEIGCVKYMPDFYCKEEDAYYEVVGTKQAYKQNLSKYLLMSKFFPEVKFFVVTSNGTPYRKAILHSGYKNNSIHPLVKYLSEHCLNANQFSKNIGVDPARISRVINGKQCSKETAAKISLATNGCVFISYLRSADR